MSYPEYILRRSEALWKELEEVWRRALTTAAGARREGGAGAGAAGDENAARRIAEKLFPAGGETAAETAGRLALPERGVREGGGARWLADELRRGTAEGIAPERVRGSDAGFAPLCEAADLQTLSQSVERDARRYDGGFLLY